MTGYPPIVELADLGPLGPSIVGPNAGGESIGIQTLDDDPEMLAKLYNPRRLARPDIGALDRLVGLPEHLGADGVRLRSTTSWPRSRIVSGGRTIGVLIPAAPKAMAAEVQSPITGKGETRLIEVDLLAKPDEYIARRGLPAPGLLDRLTVCRQLAAVGAILSGNGVVYADWSYANTFWGPHDNTVFVIDVDSCSFGSRGHVQTVGFEDPLTPIGVRVDAATDQYRLALLIARCLTGMRERDEVIDELSSIDPWLHGARDVLLDILTSTDRGRRLPLRRLADVLDQASPDRSSTVDGANVTKWRPRGGPPAQRGHVTVGSSSVQAPSAVKTNQMARTPPTQARRSPLTTRSWNLPNAAAWTPPKKGFWRRLLDRWN